MGEGQVRHRHTPRGAEALLPPDEVLTLPSHARLGRCDRQRAHPYADQELAVSDDGRIMPGESLGAIAQVAHALHCPARAGLPRCPREQGGGRAPQQTARSMPHVPQSPLPASRTHPRQSRRAVAWGRGCPPLALARSTQRRPPPPPSPRSVLSSGPFNEAHRSRCLAGARPGPPPGGAARAAAYGMGIIACYRYRLVKPAR